MNSAIKEYSAEFLNEVLRELIIARRSKYPRMTRKELADELGIDPSSAMRLENGESDLSIERYIQICTILKQNPVEILHKAALRVGTIHGKL